MVRQFEVDTSSQAGTAVNSAEVIDAAGAVILRIKLLEAEAAARSVDAQMVTTITGLVDAAARLQAALESSAVTRA